MASNPEPRNWKGIIISILVILSVILMVALAVVWMTPPDPGPRDDCECVFPCKNKQYEKNMKILYSENYW